MHLAYDQKWHKLSNEFKGLIDSGHLPSGALKKTIAENKDYPVDPDTILSLLVHAYPGIAPQGLIDWLCESQYPAKKHVLDDQGFDNTINGLLEESLRGW